MSRFNPDRQNLEKERELVVDRLEVLEAVQANGFEAFWERYVIRPIDEKIRKLLADEQMDPNRLRGCLEAWHEMKDLYTGDLNSLSRRLNEIDTKLKALREYEKQRTEP